MLNDRSFDNTKSSNSINDINIGNDVIVNKLKGEKGSPVKLQVYRKDDNKTFSVNIKRDVVPIKSVEAYYMLTKDMGYIKVNRFAESTYKGALIEQELGRRSTIDVLLLQNNALNAKVSLARFEQSLSHAQSQLLVLLNTKISS